MSTGESTAWPWGSGQSDVHDPMWHQHVSEDHMHTNSIDDIPDAYIAGILVGFQGKDQQFGDNQKPQYALGCSPNQCDQLTQDCTMNCMAPCAVQHDCCDPQDTYICNNEKCNGEAPINAYMLPQKTMPHQVNNLSQTISSQEPSTPIQFNYQCLNTFENGFPHTLANHAFESCQLAVHSPDDQHTNNNFANEAMDGFGMCSGPFANSITQPMAQLQTNALYQTATGFVSGSFPQYQVHSLHDAAAYRSPFAATDGKRITQFTPEINAFTMTSRSDSPPSCLISDTSLSRTDSRQSDGDLGHHMCRWENCTDIFADRGDLHNHLIYCHVNRLSSRKKAGGKAAKRICCWEGCKYNREGQKEWKMLQHLKDHMRTHSQSEAL